MWLNSREKAEKPLKFYFNFTVHAMTNLLLKCILFDAESKVVFKTFKTLAQLTMHFVAYLKF